MASVTITRRRNWQPAAAQRPNVGLLGPGAFVWSGAQPNIVSAHGFDRFGANSAIAGRAFSKGYQGAYWAATTGDGLRFPKWRPAITSACTIFVVAAPASGNANAETAFALSPDASVYSKFPSVVFSFNTNYYGSASNPGQATLTIPNTTTERAVWALSAGIDGGVHCWAAGVDTTSGYILVDGVDSTYLGDGFSGTMTRDEQQTFIGSHPAYDGARTMTSPLYLVVVTPRKLPMELAAAYSRELLRSPALAFAKRSVRAFRATSAGAAFAARYYYDMIAAGGRLGG
ncbi:MAG: hypothetical protein KAX77_00270 [Xanthomonadales bacterium]|nr:hypothetical protein [Xanthomonadales bacterium]